MAAYNCSHCFMVSLSRHCHPQSFSHERRCSAHTMGLWHPSFWFCSFSLSHTYFRLPVAFVESLGYYGNLCSRQKQLSLSFPLALSQSLYPSLSLPVLLSQGLVLVLIKAVSFCLLPAFSTACCELRGNSNTEWRGMRRWLNPEDGENKFWVTLPVKETCNFPPKARCLE